MVATVCVIDTLRSLANGSISGTYAAVGTKFGHTVRLICFTNATDGDMLFTDDLSVDKLFIAANSFKLFDLTTNRENNSPIFVLPKNTQFYVKQSTAPTTGSVYIECIYGSGE